MGSNSINIQAILDAEGVRSKLVTPIPKDGLTDLMRSIILKEAKEEPFYVLDLGVVMSRMETWAHSLPMIQPFYAVKCNPHSAMIGAMAALGASFDCASRAEIESVLSLGISPKRIAYANPCKAESHIRYAASVGVDLTTFDSIDEVKKIRKWHPNTALLLRVKAPDDEGARCPLGAKYGALDEEIEPLLQAAHDTGLTVSGVSFHIGSGATESIPYRVAIKAAKSAFETAARLGLPKMHVLNIGGGFTTETFDEAALTIKAGLVDYFSDVPDLTVIAEPGRFFAESAFTLATTIIGKRVRGGGLREYFINDGVYGSMNCILYDHATVTCTPLATSSNREYPKSEEEVRYGSTVFGPTCDALDTILTGYLLPELEVNDWLVFPNMGAYTAAAGSSFNGFKTSEILTYLAYSSPY
ncbi:ornithine decarboxylase-like [Tripterygium wilfordii]|uniref:ornithine decarboxylase n=1 Tax=Tripterygium wilfordii TaxID=458696 RepID=A0A7J7D3R9_TRIWF|nr:ornithine decarboxylase-like [Tripterygium wilfordii]KAF5740908.1 ornithine decarboxylase-like [Tripterygium wilfordii]